MKRKIITLFLTLTLIFSALPPTVQAQRLFFADVDANHHLVPFLRNLIEVEIDAFQGVMGENGNVFLQPLRTMTRAEFAAIMVRSFDLHEENPTNPFDDVSNTAWYASYVATAAASGVIYGINPDGTLFAPNASITRQEAFAMFARICMRYPWFDELEQNKQEALARFQDAAQLASWAVSDTAFLASHELVTGVGIGAPGSYVLFPLRDLTRGDAVVLLARVALTIRFAEIMNQPPTTLPPDFVPQRTFPPASLEALRERILQAETYLTLPMQRRISTETFAELREMHRRAVIAYNLENLVQQIINRAYYELTAAIANLVILQKDDLREAIDYANGYDHRVWHLYTRTSFHAMVEARTHAIYAYYSKINVPQTYIDAARDALLEAIENLVKAQHDALTAAYRDTAPDSERWFLYTSESFDAFLSARSAACVVYRGLREQYQIDEATEALIAAWNNLEQLPKEEFLLRVIRLGEVSAQLEYRFTPESFVHLRPALNAARDRYQIGGTFEEHYIAACTLNQAIRGLVITYRRQLPVFIAHARIYVNHPRYTAESRSVMQAAIERAQAALDDETLPDAYLGEVLEALIQTILNLERA